MEMCGRRSNFVPFLVISINGHQPAIGRKKLNNILDRNIQQIKHEIWRCHLSGL